MNTGVQRSSATPLGAWTTTTPSPSGEGRPKKDLAAILAAHRIPYLATASVSDPEDLTAKVRAARKIRGFRFLHVLVPCPVGWMFPARETVALGRLAVQARVFPLFEVFGGREWRLPPAEEKIPVSRYLEKQGRFRGLGEEAVLHIQEEVDRRWEELLLRATQGRRP
jgi:pyruvate/2-oxoacid:ferredoxin oxidoreductase beta subunit